MENYETLKVIYRTANVEVLKCKNIKHQVTCCIKCIPVQDVSDVEYFTQEIMNLYSLKKYPYFLGFYEYFFMGNNKQIDKICMVTEFCEKGDLARELDRRQLQDDPFTDADLQVHIKFLLKGFKKLQQSGISHRDIKPENIFIATDGGLKIGDLGSCNTRVETMQTIIGSPIYMSPEIRDNFQQFQAGKIGPKVNYNAVKSDVWSLGLTFLFMISNRNVKEFVKAQAYQEKIDNRLNTIENPIYRKLLARMLVIDQENRADFIELEEMFKREIEESKRAVPVVEEKMQDIDIQVNERVEEVKEIAPEEFSNGPNKLNAVFGEIHSYQGSPPKPIDLQYPSSSPVKVQLSQEPPKLSPNQENNYRFPPNYPQSDARDGKAPIPIQDRNEMIIRNNPGGFQSVSPNQANNYRFPANYPQSDARDGKVPIPIQDRNEMIIRNNPGGFQSIFPSSKQIKDAIGVNMPKEFPLVVPFSNPSKDIKQIDRSQPGVNNAQRVPLPIQSSAPKTLPTGIDRHNIFPVPVSEVPKVRSGNQEFPRALNLTPPPLSQPKVQADLPGEINSARDELQGKPAPNYYQPVSNNNISDYHDQASLHAPAPDYYKHSEEEKPLHYGYHTTIDEGTIAKDQAEEMRDMHKYSRPLQENSLKTDSNTCSYCKKTGKMIKCHNCRAEIHPYCLNKSSNACNSCSYQFNKTEYNPGCEGCGNTMNVTLVQFCNHLLCAPCQTKNKNCKYCFHFELIGESGRSDVNFPEVDCFLCRNRLAKYERVYFCPKDHYQLCIVCKNVSHQGPCTLNDIRAEITCAGCNGIAIKNKNSFIYYCTSCKNHRCLVCAKEMLETSHVGCAILYSRHN